jgi:hypothetical protein
MSIKQKKKRTHIIGALIFVALIAFLGVGLAATGNFHNPLPFFGGGGEHRGGPGGAPGQAANFHPDRGSGGAPSDRAGGPGSGFAPSDHEGGPDGENNGGIAWNQIGAVFSDLWILGAIAAGYILIQQVFGVIANHFWTPKDPQITT